MPQIPPQLPDDPTSAQVDAWIEPAELVSDDDFRYTMRQMVLGGESDNRIAPTDLGDTETHALLEWLDLVIEPRVERYWQLLSLTNDHPPGPRRVPAFAWLADALRAHR